MIPPETIRTILETAQIKDVVEDYVALRKRGVNYVGLCPFHNDKTPSFYVSPSKNICHCFVCQGGGTPANFIMQIENVGYIEAVKLLAKKYNIEIQEKELTPEEKALAGERESMRAVNNWLNGHFINNLTQTEEGQNIGLTYFQQKRQFREDIIKKFQLGYAIDRRDEYTQAAQAKGYKLEYLLKLGASIQNEEHGNVFDRYYGRVIFPIHSISGEVIAFGGRTLKKDDKAKYQNSPESEIYQKKLALYGLYFAKRAIQREKSCYIVEGYCDVVSMVQAGIENIVAPCGTALTTEQIGILKRVIPSIGDDDNEDKNVTMMYDGDEAGVHAALKNGKLLLEQGLNVHCVILPPEDDPDTFAHKHNGNEVKEYLEQNRQDYVLFYAKHFGTDENNPLQRANAIAETAGVIAAIPDKTKRTVYLQECSKLLDVPQNDFFDKVAEIIKKRAAEHYKQQMRGSYNGSYSSTSSTAPATPTAVPTAPATPVTSATTPQTPTGAPTGSYVTIPPATTAADLNQQYPYYKFERRLLFYLLRYTHEVLFRTINTETKNKKDVELCQFIYRQMDEDHLGFEYEIHQKISDELREHLEEPDFKAEPYFLYHPDLEISTYTSRLMNNKYQPEEDNNLFKNVTNDMNAYKIQFLDNELNKIREQIPLAATTEDRLALVKKFSQINLAKKSISKENGTVLTQNRNLPQA